MKIILFALIFLGLGCASRSDVMTGAKVGLLFPYGTYQHRVGLRILKPTLQNMQLRGVVSLKEQQLRVVGLSPMNTTLFRIIDPMSSEITLEIYDERLKPMNSRLKQYFHLMKRVLLLRRENIPQNLVSDSGEEIALSIGKYDQFGIPTRINLVSQNFNIQIDVSEYDLE